MITATKKIWMDGEFVDWDKANVHVLTHSLHYGGGVFEGIRCYETPQGPAVFRLTDHMRRFSESGKIAMAESEFSTEQLIEAVKETIRINEISACYIRPLAFRAYGEMGLNPLRNRIATMIAVWPWGDYLGENSAETGITAGISSWHRPDHNSMPPTAKATANYINSQLAKVEAIRNGYEEAIMLNSTGYVAEGSAENLFVVKNGRIYTPPTSAAALKGIRRDSVIRVARDLGYEVIEGNVVRADLYTADEVFCTGTATEVVPLRAIDGREIAKPWTVTSAIQAVMNDAVRGKDDRYASWVEHV